MNDGVIWVFGGKRRVFLKNPRIHEKLEEYEVNFKGFPDNLLFNTLHGWRFSFGRKTSKRRLEVLDLAPLHNEAPIDIEYEIRNNNALMTQLLKEKEKEFEGK